MSGIAAAAPNAIFTQITPSVSQAVSAAANGYGKSPAAVIAHADAALMQLQLHAAQAAAKAGEKAVAKPEGAPQLRAPAAGVPVDQDAYSLEAQLMKVLAEIGALIGEASVSTIVAQMKIFLARAAAAVANNQALSKDCAEALAKADQAVAELSMATDAAAEAAAKEGAAIAARDELAAQLEAMDPDAPEYSALQSKLEEAQSKASSAAAAAAAANKALAPLQHKADEAIAAYEKVRKQANGAARDPLAKAPNETELSHAAALAQMLALLNEISSKAQIQQLEADTRYAVEVIQKGVEENMKRSEEYEKQVEKARQAERTMGCIGKVLGWALTIVMTLAAPFTGGASMVLAAVFLTMAIAEEVSGYSLIGEALKPVMEHVVQPLIKGLAKIFSEALKAVGVSADIADKVALAMASIAAAAIMILAFVAVRSAASKLIGPMLKSLGTQISKVMPKVVTQFGTGFSEQAVSRAGKVMAVAEIGGTVQGTAQGVGQVVVADMNVKSVELLVQMALQQKSSEVMEQILSLVQDLFERATTAEKHFFQIISNVLSSEQETASSVISRMRNA